jgi:hypothetical protein
MGGVSKAVANIPKTVAQVITGKSSGGGTVQPEPGKLASLAPTAPAAPAAQAAAATAAQAAGLGATGAMAGTRRRGRAANILMGEAAGNTNVGQKRLLGE